MNCDRLKNTYFAMFLSGPTKQVDMDLLHSPSPTIIETSYTYGHFLLGPIKKDHAISKGRRTKFSGLCWQCLTSFERSNNYDVCRQPLMVLFTLATVLIDAAISNADKPFIKSDSRIMSAQPRTEHRNLHFFLFRIVNSDAVSFKQRPI